MHKTHLLICPQARLADAVAVLGDTPHDVRALTGGRSLVTFSSPDALLSTLRAAGFAPQANTRLVPVDALDLRAGDVTPHGAAEFVEEVEPGVFMYQTSGHGGYWLRAAVNARIPGYARDESGFYEEDCASSIPAYFLPFNGGRHREGALEFLRAYYPDIVAHPEFPLS